MEEFVDKLNNLLLNDIDISVKHYNVTHECFAFDTPARGFLKSKMGHTTKYACERCTVKETRNNVKSTVYPAINSQERTDKFCRNMNQAWHHHQPPPVLCIHPEINMVFSFVLDIMHLCFLEVMKGLKEWWLTGELTIRLGQRMNQELSKRIKDFSWSRSIPTTKIQINFYLHWITR